MNVLVAGGTGLIGRAVTEKLVGNGHSVIILSRNSKKVEGIPDSVRVIEWDGETTAGWSSVLSEVDAVVNLAGAPLNGNSPLNIWLTQKRRKQLIESRLNTTKALLDGIEKSAKRPSVFVQASAIGYYGPRGDEKVYESDTPGSDFMANVLIQTEKASERATELGMRRVVIRTSLVLDWNDGAFQYFKLQFTMFAGGQLGDGKQYYSWIHLEDEAAAICYLLENDKASGVYNLAAPNPVTNKEFAKILGQAMHRPSFFIVPGFVLRLFLGEISTVVLDGQRVVPKRLLELGYEFKFENLEEALADIVK